MLEPECCPSVLRWLPDQECRRCHDFRNGSVLKIQAITPLPCTPRLHSGGHVVEYLRSSTFYCNLQVHCPCCPCQTWLGVSRTLKGSQTLASDAKACEYSLLCTCAWSSEPAAEEQAPYARGLLSPRMHECIQRCTCCENLFSVPKKECAELRLGLFSLRL